MNHPSERPPLPLPQEAIDLLLSTLRECNYYDLHDAVLLILELGLTPRQLEKLCWSKLRFPAGKLVIELGNENLLLPSSPALERLFQSRKESSIGRDSVFDVSMYLLDRQLESHSIRAGLGLITLSTIQTMFTQTLLSKLRAGKFADFLLLARIG